MGDEGNDVYGQADPVPEDGAERRAADLAWAGSSAPIVAWLPEENEQERSRRTAVRWSPAVIALGAVAMVGSLMLVAAIQQPTRPVPAPIVADHDTHRIERVQPDAHTVPVRFNLLSQGAPLITEISTNQQCATARLSQGNRSTPWLSTGSKARERFDGLQLVPFQPAYLEVSIDPATHGADPGVALKHTVQVRTADGQRLSFDVLTGSR